MTDQWKIGKVDDSILEIMNKSLESHNLKFIIHTKRERLIYAPRGFEYLNKDWYSLEVKHLNESKD